MVQFQINDTLIELTDDITLLDAKKEIMKQCNVDKPYIDIKYILEKPIRILGKFNVEPGVVPRTLDRYKLERFAFNDVIQVEIIEVDDYDPSKLNRVALMSGGRGRGRGRGPVRGTTTNTYVAPSTRNESTFDHSSNQITMTTEPTFSLESEDDFPTLGK